MRKRIRIIVFFALTGFVTSGQNTINLSYCLQKAIENSPDAASKQVYQDMNRIGSKQIENSWLPEINLNVQATYQSQVTEVNLSDLPFPANIPSPDKDQYKAVVQFNQKLYDAGMSKYLKLINDKTYEINIQNTAVSNQNLKVKVATLFFSVMLVNDQLEINKLLKKNLKTNLKNVESGIENGILKKADKDLLQVELIRLGQKILDLETKRTYLINTLNEMTSVEADTGFVFHADLETVEIPDIMDISKRPEKGLFNLQKEKIEFTKGLTQRSRYPFVTAFGQAGYGKPGLDFLSDQFNPYFIGGVSIVWNIWDWNDSKNKLQLLDNQKALIGINEQNFERSIKILLEEKTNDIKKYERMIKQDEQIINLLTDVENTASSQLKNGVISSSEYLIEMNRKIQAQLSLTLHQVLSDQAKAGYLLISGLL